MGPTGSHRVPPNPIWVPRREELGPTGSHRAQFGSHRREELGPTGSHQVRIKAGVFEGTILSPENAHASGFNIVCLYSRLQGQIIQGCSSIALFTQFYVSGLYSLCGRVTFGTSSNPKALNPKFGPKSKPLNLNVNTALPKALDPEIHVLILGCCAGVEARTQVA